ncbi:MAG: N-6 DNA methylase [Chitinivibrionales bacterium]|nr:N-6 DNA methylase [Chitinivibrionales bacterium]
MPKNVSKPSIDADTLGLQYSGNQDVIHKKAFGQYLTPIEVASFMASLTIPQKSSNIRLLDPGIGSGILVISLIERIVENWQEVQNIHVTGYEIDTALEPICKKALDSTVRWAKNSKVNLTYEIRFKDFIIDNAHVLHDGPTLISKLKIGSDDEPYDLVISNPPYFKIPKDDPRAKAAKNIVYGQPNIYALFMAVSTRLLSRTGQMVFITPRSYASGPYFRAFREFLFSEITPKQLHLFCSRTDAFDRDAILQENVILHARRRTNGNGSTKVKISFSHGSRDLEACPSRTLALESIIKLKSLNKVLFLPTSKDEDKIIETVNSWKGSLHKFDMEISTGKVVPFRATEYLLNEGDIENGEAPLIWMNSIRDSQIIWPLSKNRKPQYIRIQDETLPLLNKNGNYILLRRFSAKEEKKRLNSSPYIQDRIKSEYVAFENHVNFVHRPHGNISRTEAFGISAILNSSYLDGFFRISNGNTQVSATEIRDIPLPDLSLIRKIGEALENSLNINIDEILLAKAA